MYNQMVEPEVMRDALNLDKSWKDLEKAAKKKEHQLGETKKEYASITEAQVAEFQKSIQSVYVDYKASGPGSPDVTLDEGLEQLGKYREMVIDFNQRKDELVMAQKLFNLKISIFKELVAIDEENKKLSVMYNLYKDFKQEVKEWSTMLWAKLDAETLKTGAEAYDKKRKKLVKENGDNVIC